MINHGCLTSIINIGHSSEHIKNEDIRVQITVSQHPDLEVHFHDGENLYVSTILRDSFTLIPPLYSIIKILDFAILLKTVVVFDFTIISQETDIVKTVQNQDKKLDYHPIYNGQLPVMPKKRYHLLLQPLQQYPPPPLPIKPVYIKTTNSIQYPITELYNNQIKLAIASKLTTPINNSEILFWKVIHNKYLFKMIINKIHTTDWMHSTSQFDCRQYHIDNRIRFKNIASLEWMVKNEMFELLKLKLMTNEYIEIKESGILIFMESISKSGNGEEDIVSTLFKLLLEKKNVELKGFNLFKLALQNTNLKVIEILASNPNRTIIDTISYPSQFRNLKVSNSIIKSLKSVTEIPKVIIYSCKPFGSLFSDQKDNHLLNNGGSDDIECLDETEIKSIFLNSTNQQDYDIKISNYCKKVGYIGKDEYETRTVIPKEWDEYLVYSLNSGLWILEGSHNWRTENRDVKWVKEILDTNNVTTSELLFDQCKLRYYYYYITPRTQHEIFERLYFIPFIKALSNCNIQELKRIGNEIIQDVDIGTSSRNYSYLFFEFNKQCSISNIIETVQYINSTGYQNFNNQSFYNLFKSTMEMCGPQFNIQDILNVNDIISLDKQFLLELLSLFSPQILEIIFKDNQHHTILVGFTIPLPLIEKIKCKRAPIQDVIKCIEMLVVQFNILANNENINEDGTNLLNLLEELINFYYFELIQNHQISIGKLKSIHQTIVKNEKIIQLNYSANHFILYLGIKSNKLEKFIHQDIYRKHLIGDVPLSFELIFGTYEYTSGDNGISFNDIFQLLIHDLCHVPLMTTIKSDRYRSLYFNYTLIYLLQVKKVDLFFRELEYIKLFCNQEISGNNFSIRKQYEPSDSLYESILKTLDDESLFLFATSFMKRFKKPKDSLNYMDIILKCFTLNSKKILKYFNLDSIIPSILSSFSPSVISLIKKYKNLFFPSNGSNGIIHLGKLFNGSVYQCYDIELHTLFLKAVPNHRFFAFNTEKIDRALEVGKLSFLLHFYQNGIINDNSCLVKYLQFKLTMHLDYQCIDWKNMI